MKIREVREELSKQLGEFIGEYGFRDKGSNCIFTAKSGGVVQIFWCFVFSKTTWFFVKPGVFVGHPEINKMFKQILEWKDPVKMTNGFGIANEYQNRGDYIMENREQIFGTARQIEKDFKEIAIPYFDCNSDLVSIESNLNRRKSNGSYVESESVSDACMGLIAAKLCKRDDLLEMADFYYNFFVKVQGKECSMPILKMKEFLLLQGTK